MIPKEFDAITKADIDSLVTNAVAERRTIDYKQELPGNNDDAKREILADVSSFANAAGGDIVYGVTEQRDQDAKPTGTPDKAEGMKDVNADAEKLRLEQIIRSGIDPRIPGIRIGHFDGFPSGTVMVIRVPKSWASPHMVTFKNLSRFYTRSSAGKYPLDVREIRAAFTASGDLRSRISAFRTDRLAKIIADETPVSLPPFPKVVLHLVPLTILDPSTQIDIATLWNDPNLAAPIQNESYDRRFNLDGYLSIGPGRRGEGYRGYTQAFRSGAIEAVDADLLQYSNVEKLVASARVGKKMIDAMQRYVKTAQQLGVPLPFVIMVTMLGLKGYAMATNSPWQNQNPSHRIDRDTLVFPDMLLEDFTTPADKLLKPVLDAFWQSAGFSCCEQYNAGGRWDGGLSTMNSGGFA